jgi:hypothetical protein
MKGSCKADGKAASSTAYGSRPSSIKKKKRKALDGSVIDVDNGSELTESQTRATESIEKMTGVHQMMAHASFANALGRDEQALVGIQKGVQALEEKVFHLEDQIDDETNPGRKQRLQIRLKTAEAQLREQEERYGRLRDDIEHRRTCLEFTPAGNTDNEEDNEEE